MSTSKKQITANQNNAQKSTGPKTIAGKVRSKQNATTHGLYAENTVINSPHLKENQEDYDNLLHGLIEELAPKGIFETRQVQAIANCLWRQSRAINAETAHISDKLQTQANLSLSNATEEQKATRAAARSIPTGSFSQELLRYEMRLDIRLNRALKTLRHLQSLRFALKKSHGTPPLAVGSNDQVHSIDNNNPTQKPNSTESAETTANQTTKQLGNEPNPSKLSDLEALEAIEILNFDNPEAQTP